MNKKIFGFLLVLGMILCLGIVLCYAQDGAIPLGSKEPAVESLPVEAEVEAEKEADINLVVENALCGTGLENREIVGEATTFSPSVERIYCATLIKGATSPTTIKHVWYYNDQKMTEVPLDIKYASFRTWSYKTMAPQWTGTWRVEVMDENDKVLKIIGFEITETAAESVEEKEQLQEGQQTE